MYKNMAIIVPNSHYINYLGLVPTNLYTGASIFTLLSDKVGEKHMAIRVNT